MKIVTGFAVINDRNGERITYTYDEVDDKGNILKSNVKESYLAMDAETKDAIAALRGIIEARMLEA